MQGFSAVYIPNPVIAPRLYQSRLSHFIVLEFSILFIINSRVRQLHIEVIVFFENQCTLNDRYNYI